MIILSDTFGRKFHFNRIEEYLVWNGGCW